MRPRVVFADDSLAQRLMVPSILGDGYDVVTVSDGLAALAAIRGVRPEVVIADLEMPGLNGVELLRLVKADPERRRTRFLLATAHQRAALAAMQAGADDYLTKPYAPEELRARVMAAVRSFRMYLELERQQEELVQAHAASRRLELELHQAQKLEAVGRLASGIAHEINTPIQFIGDNTRFLDDAFRGLADVLREHEATLAALKPPLETRARLERMAREADLAYLLEQAPRAIERTLEGVRRVATIVRAMKEFAHPDQKEMVATDLNRALEATLEVARNEYKYVANVETELGALPKVLCHAGDVNQVFLNLIVNAAYAIGDAVKGTGRRGKIRIRTSEEGGAVTATIGDDGSGIPEAIRDKIFEPFFTTKPVGRGTGQGLAIARSVVEQHGGKIWFESEPGKGTAFHVRLPINGPQKTGSGS
jgi:signal transduction histidine kinase